MVVLNNNEQLLKTNHIRDNKCIYGKWSNGIVNALLVLQIFTPIILARYGTSVSVLMVFA